MKSFTWRSRSRITARGWLFCSCHDVSAIRTSPADRTLRTDGAIRNREPLVDDAERLAEFGFCDAQWRVGEERVPADKRVQTVVAEKSRERRHFLRRPIERRERLTRLLIANQLDQSEEPNRAGRAH